MEGEAPPQVFPQPSLAVSSSPRSKKDTRDQGVWLPLNALTVTFPTEGQKISAGPGILQDVLLCSTHLLGSLMALSRACSPWWGGCTSALHGPRDSGLLQMQGDLGPTRHPAQACEAEVWESVCMQATISPESPASSESESEGGKGFIDDKILPSHLIF